jgi:hypothetical protein
MRADARRPVALLALATLLAAACSGDEAATTTTTEVVTTSSSTTSTTTTLPGSLVELEVNGDPILTVGDRNEYVYALQFYLVCTGHEFLWEGGPQVTVDGVFGPITGDAVAVAQAERRRIPTGDPDEWLFASLARSCSQERAIVFGDGVTTAGVAGNVTEGDNEVFTISGAEGQSLSVFVVEGDVSYSIAGVDGTEIKSADEPGNWTGSLPVTQNYRIEVVTNGGDTSYWLSVDLPPPSTVAIDWGPMRLANGGLGVADFGEDPDTTIEVLTFVMGEPTDDSGWILGTDPDRPSCSGANRHLTWIVQEPVPVEADPNDEATPEPGGPAAILEVDFSDINAGVREFAQYTYRSAAPATVDSGARGLATVEGITIGSTFDQFVAAYGDPDWLEEDLGIARFAGAMTVELEVPPPDGEGNEVLRVLSISAGADGCADRG